MTSTSYNPLPLQSCLNTPVDGWLLCAHPVVHRPHPHCLFLMPRRCRSPHAHFCPARTTKTADPPPEVGEGRLINAPDVADGGARCPPCPVWHHWRKAKTKAMIRLRCFGCSCRREDGVCVGDGHDIDGRRRPPTTLAPSGDNKGVLGREHESFRWG